MFGFSIGSRATHNKNKTNGMAKSASERGSEAAAPDISTSLLQVDKFESSLERSERHTAELNGFKTKNAILGAVFGTVPFFGPGISGCLLGETLSDGQKLTKLNKLGVTVALGAAGLGLGLLAGAAGPEFFSAGLLISSLVGGYAAAKGAEAQYKELGEKRDSLVK